MGDDLYELLFEKPGSLLYGCGHCATEFSPSWSDVDGLGRCIPLSTWMDLGGAPEQPSKPGTGGREWRWDTHRRGICHGSNVDPKELTRKLSGVAQQLSAPGEMFEKNRKGNLFDGEFYAATIDDFVVKKLKEGPRSWDTNVWKTGEFFGLKPTLYGIQPMFSFPRLR